MIPIFFDNRGIRMIDRFGFFTGLPQFGDDRIPCGSGQVAQPKEPLQ